MATLTNEEASEEVNGEANEEAPHALQGVVTLTATWVEVMVAGLVGPTVEGIAGRAPTGQKVHETRGHCRRGE